MSVHTVTGSILTLRLRRVELIPILFYIKGMEEMVPFPNTDCAECAKQTVPALE